MANENQGDNRPINPVGLYTHKESGATEIAVDPVQGDAFVRLGFVYSGPANAAPVDAPAEPEVEPEVVEEDSTPGSISNPLPPA